MPSPMCFTNVKKHLALLKGIHQEHIKWMEGSVTKGKLTFIAAVLNGLPVGNVGSLWAAPLTRYPSATGELGSVRVRRENG